MASSAILSSFNNNAGLVVEYLYELSTKRCVAGHFNSTYATHRRLGVFCVLYRLGVLRYLHRHPVLPLEHLH